MNLNDCRYKLITDDAIQTVKQFEDQKFQLILTSPPYNVGKIYEKKKPLEDYLAWQESLISYLPRILSDQGSVVWQVGNFVEDKEVFPLDIYLYPIFKKLGFKLRNRIIWHFGHGLHCKYRLSGRYETLLWFSKTANYVFNLDNIRVPSKYPNKKYYKGPHKGELSGNPLGKNPSDFWNTLYEEHESGILNLSNVKAGHSDKTNHPCQFPVALAERCVLAYTNENDWVLDPFGGTGTTAIAALNHNRKVVSIDIDSGYTEIAQQRISAFENGTLKFRGLIETI